MRPFGFELELLKIPDHGLHKVGNVFYRFDYESSVACGGECQSPILSSLESIPEIVKYLKQMGGKSGPKCGLHVHVGITWKSACRNLHFRVKLKKIIETLWKEKKQCALKQFPLSGVRKRYCGYGQIKSEKTSAINFLTSYDTIEFRTFNGILDTRYICRAICFACNFVDEIERACGLEVNVTNPVGVG